MSDFIGIQRHERTNYLFLSPDDLRKPEALFVYGSLRTGSPCAIAHVGGVLYDVGHAVATQVNTSGTVIIGELVYCEKEFLEKILDRYEVVPYIYTRVRTQTIWPEETDCWIYVAGEERANVDHLPDNCRLKSPASWRPETYLKMLHENQHNFDEICTKKEYQEVVSGFAERWIN